MEEFKIVEYENIYKKQVIEFIKSVVINEFGFEEWRDYLDNKSFEPYYEYGSKFLIIFNSQNKIIGTCGGLRKSDDTIKLNSFYMLNDYRQQGLGSKIYNLILDYAKECKYKTMILTTNSKFDIAIKFYEKRGFKVYKIEDDGRIRYKKEL